MALRDWQMALGQLVEARSAGRAQRPVPDVLAGLALDDAERAWLAQVTATRGFGLTSFVPRWWRETRVRRSARLTFAALGAAAAKHLGDYIRAVPNFTLFFVPEGLGFIDYVEALAVPDVVHAIARFERAMWNVKLGAPATAGAVGDDEPLVRHPAADLIAFEASPELVLAAVMQGQPPPAPDEAPHHVLVAPGVPGMWRAATGDEARAFAACHPAATARALQSLPGVTPSIVAGLRREGALIRAARAAQRPDRHSP